MKAAAVREGRIRLGMTQEQFATELGVTFSTVNRWENGRVRPSRLAVRALRALFLARLVETVPPALKQR